MDNLGILALGRGSVSSSVRISANPRTPFKGVRGSWDMLARNSDFIWLAPPPLLCIFQAPEGFGHRVGHAVERAGELADFVPRRDIQPVFEGHRPGSGEYRQPCR